MTNDRQKLLGQFFSGHRIANLIAELTDDDSVKTVIDPMCGIGDLLYPFRETKEITGIEIDSKLIDTLEKDFPEGNIYNVNAFSAQVLSALNYDGYDLVVANPPFIRKELIGKSELSLFSLSDIKCNLHFFTDSYNTYDSEEKAKIHKTIDSLSGLTDIAIPSWLLCMLLVKHGGRFAIVVPNSWLSREYAQPILKLIDELFTIDYVVNDVSGAWFKGNALVRTSIIIATHSKTTSQPIRFVNLYEKALSEESLYGGSGIEEKFADFIKKGESIPNVCEISTSSKNSLANIQTDRFQMLMSALSEKPFDGRRFTTLGDLGVQISQGLRTGANQFFYLEKNGECCNSRLSSLPIHYNRDFFLPVIQCQKELSDSYVVPNDRNVYLLYIQKAITSKDFQETFEFNKIGYDVLPEDIEQYIEDSEAVEIKSTPLPQLSSVKTNVRKRDNSNFRFWYMLPKLQSRHTAKVFMPRVNNLDVNVYMSDLTTETVIDANFSTFVLSDKSQLTVYGLMALLNSNFCKVQYELLGTVMGGGALKLEAVQLNKVKIPRLSAETIATLNEYGKTLSAEKISLSAKKISLIDNLLAKELFKTDENTTAFITSLNQELTHLREARL